MSGVSSAETPAIIERYGTREKFLLTFTPDRQVTYCPEEQRCVMGHAPTLGAVDRAYGGNTSAAWLVIQLSNLSEFCGCRDKLSVGQLEELARIITQSYPYLKITEMMLFFYRFKQGRYGRFYGTVDPLVITTSLSVFIRERGELLTRYERQACNTVAEDETSCITYEEYKRRLKEKKEKNEKYQ